MENEILIFLALLISNFSLILLLSIMGRDYLYGYAMLSGGLIIALIPLSISVLGYPFAILEIMYASLFLITDIIGELYSIRQARKVVIFAALGMLIGLIFIKFGVMFQPSEFDLTGGYLETVSSIFTVVTLVMVVSAFLVEQNVDIFSFHFIKKVTKDRYLWLRNCGSTFITQSIDVLVVYPLFFYPIFGFDVWKLMATAIVFKIFIVLIDTPFIYAVKRLHGKVEVMA